MSKRRRQAKALAAQLMARGWTMAVAESCTGGGLGAALTELPGASTYFIGGFIAYANRIKEMSLGVPPSLIAEYGAVSRPVAEAMASGCRERLSVDLAVAITGIAGPSGGTPEKPVGTVYIAASTSSGTRSDRHRFPGDRNAVRNAAIDAAMTLALDATDPAHPAAARIP